MYSTNQQVNHDVTTNRHPLTVYSVLKATYTLQCCGDIKHRNIYKGIYPMLLAWVLRSFQDSAHVANVPVHWGISIQPCNVVQFPLYFMLYRRKKSAILQVQIPCYSRIRLHFTYCGMIHCIALKWISCMVKKTDCSWSLQSVTAYMQIQVFVDLPLLGKIHITYFMDKTLVFLYIAHNAHIFYVISI